MTEMQKQLHSYTRIMCCQRTYRRFFSLSFVFFLTGYWVAFYAMRDVGLDFLHPYPKLKKLLTYIPVEWIARPYGLIVHFDNQVCMNMFLLLCSLCVCLFCFRFVLFMFLFIYLIFCVSLSIVYSFLLFRSFLPLGIVSITICMHLFFLNNRLPCRALSHAHCMTPLARMYAGPLPLRKLARSCG